LLLRFSHPENAKAKAKKANEPNGQYTHVLCETDTGEAAALFTTSNDSFLAFNARINRNGCDVG
jgi:hypothetical protein